MILSGNIIAGRVLANAGSIVLSGIEPASKNQSVVSLNVAHVAVRPAMIRSDFARLIPTYNNSFRCKKSMVSKPHKIMIGDSNPLNRWMVSIRTVVLPLIPSSSQVAGFGNGSLRNAA